MLSLHPSERLVENHPRKKQAEIFSITFCCIDGHFADMIYYEREIVVESLQLTNREINGCHPECFLV